MKTKSRKGDPGLSTNQTRVENKHHKTNIASEEASFNRLEDVAPGDWSESARSEHDDHEEAQDGGTDPSASGGLQGWARGDVQNSGIPPDFTESMGWRSVDRVKAESILGFPLPADASECYAIPFYDPDTRLPLKTPDGRDFIRLRFRVPVDFRNGKKPAKYLSPKGGGQQPYILPLVAAHIRANPKAEVIMTEGEKKAVAATLKGVPTIGLVGIYGWSQKNEEESL